MTNNNSISFDIVLGQIPVGDISGGSSNIPTGMALSGSGQALTVSAGAVKVGDIKYVLEEDLTKYVNFIFEPGYGNGCRAWGEDLVDGVWYVYAVSTGKKADIFISQSLEPVFPTFEEDESCEYSTEAYKYQYGTRIGQLVIKDEVIASVYPEEDLASAYINHDLVTQPEFSAYKAKTDATLEGFASDIADLSATVDELSTEFDTLAGRVSAVEDAQESMESNMEDLWGVVDNHTNELSDLDIRTTMAEGHIIALANRVESDESSMDELEGRVSNIESLMLYAEEIPE